MIILKEVTGWGWQGHTYFVDDSQSKLLGYQIDGKSPVTFTTPMDFSKKGRKFEVVKEDLSTNTRIVAGSKGSVYYITTVNGVTRCTCAGYKYHGNCKHIKEVEK
jgi:hypothetical protein